MKRSVLGELLLPSFLLLESFSEPLYQQEQQKQDNIVRMFAKRAVWASLARQQ